MRRNILRLLGLSLAAVAVLYYINSIGDSDEAGPDPAGLLKCAKNAHIAAAYATATPTTRETRTPEELATAWARSRAGAQAATPHRVSEQPDRVDIALDAGERTVAVLTFRSHDALGWHLNAVVACQQPVTQNPSTSLSGP